VRSSERSAELRRAADRARLAAPQSKAPTTPRAHRHTGMLRARFARLKGSVASTGC
jgi:hypothetical protein